MKIRHYPGKAVVNDPAWLEMDIPNSARGLQYEANWIDTQKTLTASSSTSWDSYSSQEGNITSKLSQYQTIVTNHSNEDASSKSSSLGSVRLKYHSDKYLARVNSRTKKDHFGFHQDDYYLPSQNRLKREQSFQNPAPDYNNITEPVEERKEEIQSEQEIKPPKPKPRVKIMNENEKYRNVINDLEKQIKKSVRFNDKSTEISFDSDYEYDEGTVEGKPNWEETETIEEENNKENKVRVILNPLVEEIYPQPQKLTIKEPETIEPIPRKPNEGTQERINEWIDDQNKYILTINDDFIKNDETFDEKNTLNRNDSGYYENTKRIRQRLPPKQIYPSSESSVELNSQKYSSDSSNYDNEDIYNLYKNGRSSPPKNDRVSVKSGSARTLPKTQPNKNVDSDFLIPRPKLIVPVHSYGVRKRRTGNLQKKSVSDYDADSVKDYGCSKTGRRTINFDENFINSIILVYLQL